MAISKSDSGWLADAQPGGRGGKRFRKTFKTQAEAKAWEAWLKTQVNQNSKWKPEKRDSRRLSELIELWHEHHGIGLRAGRETHRSLKAVCVALNDPMADQFSADMFTRYRTKRLAEGTECDHPNRWTDDHVS